MRGRVTLDRINQKLYTWPVLVSSLSVTGINSINAPMVTVLMDLLLYVLMICYRRHKSSPPNNINCHHWLENRAEVDTGYWASMTSCWDRKQAEKSHSLCRIGMDSTRQQVSLFVTAFWPCNFIKTNSLPGGSSSRYMPPQPRFPKSYDHDDADDDT